MPTSLIAPQNFLLPPSNFFLPEVDFSFLSVFLDAFLPLFVAVNIPGILPLYIGLTETMDPRARWRLLVRALTVAFILAVLMLFAGQVIFQTLGITVNDLRVGGGLILLILSITDLVFSEQMQSRRTGNGHRHEDDPDDEDAALDGGGEAPDQESLAVVPLGIPLIIGPAAITTILVSQQSYGYAPTLLSVVVNMALVFTAFHFGPRLLAALGPSTSKAIAKVASLFLAAIAIAMIRVGITNMLR
ncbi:MAG: MarC family protein [Bacteroidota bacterium]